MRNQPIDLIRGVSILLVLLNHFNIAYRLDDTLLARVFGWEAVRAVVRNGNYGVTMFFVVSGFLITSTADRRWGGLDRIDPATFYALRAARILPGVLLLVAVVNALALGGAVPFQNHPAGHGAPPSLGLVDLASLLFWMNVLIAQHGWTNYPLGVLWSLSVEEVFYLSLPVLCLLLRRDVRLLAFWTVIAALGPFYRAAHGGDEAEYLYGYLACFDAIAIGCGAAVLSKRFGVSARRAPGAALAIAVAMAALYLRWPIAQSHVFGVTAMALGTALLILLTREAPAPTALVRWGGRLSYELYLFHLVVLGLMRAVAPPRSVQGDAKLLWLLVFLGLSAGLAAALARYVTDPLNRALRRRLAVVQAA